MLQRFDGVVKSILEVRPLFPDKTDTEFAAWYEQKYMITERRVLGILQAAKEKSA